ncbi:MAG: hypothetical protein AAB307_05775, partial [Deltaproteobacteria bacterium]
MGRFSSLRRVWALAVMLPLVFITAGCNQAGMQAAMDNDRSEDRREDTVSNYSRRMIEEGRETFRYETFGSEYFWGDALRLHEAIAGEKNNGAGPGLSPRAALDAGLKIDAVKVRGGLLRTLK